MERIETICGKHKAGGPAWDALIKDALVAHADEDDDGEIGTPAELSRIPCGAWRRMDEGVTREQQSPFMVVYGFHPQLIWVGNAVGVAESLREPATARLQDCGLSADVE